MGLSRAEARSELRGLSRERRNDIRAAIREGRAVRDPRDAALAAHIAERLQAQAARVPGWLVPLRRPKGRHARLWLLHCVLLAAALAYACTTAWSSFPGPWRWLLVGLIAYCVVSAPFTLRPVLLMFWNAPDAARANRELASRRTIGA